ncbi:peptidylprolyl isomerase [Algoriphagus halophytocola]|uniref:Peptidyl-prolyl cis-trans isomerase n=1 Tax=Algoriphagus halophytocola TaxID=2991499 RepID=A0ABY6MF05_9BACT|nr:peptidylprolyl isomerase [Algoriphagus sp. TR-M5]UZD22367.1 peptidylprolyl isomerase [Algoriphagus sp. TR-M5]
MSLLRRLCYAVFFMAIFSACQSSSITKLRKSDFEKDIELVTSKGSIVLRLYDDTPLSRNNFLTLVKNGLYDSIQFHRVIESFMIQAGEPLNEEALDSNKKSHGIPEVIPAEITSTHFHKRGALGAARMGDDVNPSRNASSIQFYIVQGKKFTDGSLDQAEERVNKQIAYNQVINDPANKALFEQLQESQNSRTTSSQQTYTDLKKNLERLTEERLKTMEHFTYSAAQRETYKTEGGAAHLDQNYTVFGEVISGMEIVDQIATVPTNSRDKPLDDILILSTHLIKRQNP